MTMLKPCCVICGQQECPGHTFGHVVTNNTAVIQALEQRVDALEARAAIIDTKKGLLIPQTVDALQVVMAKDAAYLEVVERELTQLKIQYASLLRKYNQRGTQKDALNELVVRLRNALADYMASEGCGCCQDDITHAANAKRLATLLDVPAFDDGSGFNFSLYRTKE